MQLDSCLGYHGFLFGHEMGHSFSYCNSILFMSFDYLANYGLN